MSHTTPWLIQLGRGPDFLSFLSFSLFAGAGLSVSVPVSVSVSVPVPVPVPVSVSFYFTAQPKCTSSPA